MNSSTDYICQRGDGQFGRLGHGSEQKIYHPRQVEALDSEIIVDVKCGPCSTFATTSSGLVYFFGYSLGLDQEAMRKTPTILRQISGEKIISFYIRINYAAFVTEVGELFTLGNGEYGKLGHGDTLNQTLPKLVEGLSGKVCKQVSCSDHHTAVVTKCGKVYTFGRGEDGQLGHGDTKNKYLPTLVQTLEATDIIPVKCGHRFTIALSTGGCVYTWGKANADFKRSNDVILLPHLVHELLGYNVVQISTSRFTVLLVDPSPSPERSCQQEQFNNKDHSDVIFMMEHQPIYANIEVLTRKSEYFEAMFRSNMRECIEGVVMVPDVSAVLFIKLLEYLCLDDFALGDLDEALRKELGVMADMYLLEGLNFLCDSSDG